MPRFVPDQVRSRGGQMLPNPERKHHPRAGKTAIVRETLGGIVVRRLTRKEKKAWKRERTARRLMSQGEWLS